jgi:hypothetical protein
MTGDVVVTFVRTEPPLAYIVTGTHASVLQRRPATDVSLYRDDATGSALSVTGQTARYRPDSARPEATCAVRAGG